MTFSTTPNDEQAERMKMLHETEITYYLMLEALTDKEKVFVWQYLIHHNATLAAKRAGYSARSAAEIGWENLRKPHIAAAVEAGLARMAQRCEVDAERVTRELAAVGFSNIENYRIDEDGVVAL